MNIIFFIVLLCLAAIELQFFFLTIYALIRKCSMDPLPIYEEKLRYAIEETMDELGSFQIISRKYDVDEKLSQIEANILQMIDEIKKSPPPNEKKIIKFYFEFKKITDQLIDYCDEPERYFKKISDTMEG